MVLLLSLVLADDLETEGLDLPAGGEDGLPIINGEPGEDDVWPNTGGIVVDLTLFGESTRILMCSSTLIAPDVVLLAAHCIDPAVLTFGQGTVDEIYWVPKSDLTAFDGSSMPELPAGSRRAADQSMHPDWAIEELEIGLALNFDIGLLFLEEAVDVQPAVLPTLAEAQQIEIGAPVVIVGWGMRDQDGPLGVKYMGTSVLSELSDFEMHVGADTEDVRKCHGDSGGPSFMEVESDSTEIWRLIGVTSHTYDMSDCMVTGGVDTRVDYYLDWIDEEMRTRCEDDSRAWCDELGILPPPRPMTEEEIDEAIKDLTEDIVLIGCASAPGGSWLLAGLLLLLRRR